MSTQIEEATLPKLKSKARNCPDHLFDRWMPVARRLRKAAHLALFLDYDGTLVPLRHQPGEAQLDDATRAILHRLVRHPDVTVYVISGRRLADVRRCAGVRGVTYLGLHGWEGREGASSIAAALRIVRRAKSLLAQGLRDLPGIWIEEKGPVFAVHYRDAQVHAVRQARKLVHEVVGRFEPRLRVLPGKKIWEVVPHEVGSKGAAVEALLAKFPPDTLPVYVGDDTTDESAFVALPKGVTVRVDRCTESDQADVPDAGEAHAAMDDLGAPHRTKARFLVHNPREVREFLERVEEEIGKPS